MNKVEKIESALTDSNGNSSKSTTSNYSRFAIYSWQPRSKHEITIDEIRRRIRKHEIAIAKLANQAGDILCRK
jgi:Zn-finger domain-containing protein